MTPLFRTTILLVLFIFASLTSMTVQARDKAVQQWVQTKRSTISINRELPKGFSEQVSVNNLSSDIRFDPRELRDSQIMFGANFTPVTPPNGRALDEKEQAMTAGFFQSKEIKQTDDNAFEMTGTFSMGGKSHDLTIPFTVTYGGLRETKPVLVFNGTFSAALAQMAPGMGFPKFIPVAFSIETVAGP